MRPEQILNFDSQIKAPLPDVARDNVAHHPYVLEKVGMAGIETPIRLFDVFGRTFLAPATVDAFVSVDDPHAKGIHMSRLYLAVQETLPKEDFTYLLLDKLLRKFVESQRETSRSASLRLAFDLMLERPSLLSGQMGWRKYPIVVEAARSNDETQFEVQVGVLYSSTCPCSAALSRRLIQDQFRSEFGGEDAIDFDRVHRWLGSEDGIVATPHSQRSKAEVRIRAKSPSEGPTLVGLIDALETAVGTPVQAAVKREDEQEFARLNASNLMFAEDACRRFKHALESTPGVADYKIRVEHFESLHPHDAVAVAVKNVSGGYSA